MSECFLSLCTWWFNDSRRSYLPFAKRDRLPQLLTSIHITSCSSRLCRLRLWRRKIMILLRRKIMILLLDLINALVTLKIYYSLDFYQLLIALQTSWTLSLSVFLFYHIPSLYLINFNNYSYYSSSLFSLLSYNIFV